MLSPALRKVNLTAHVTSSVGWLGAVVSFLALSIAGMASDDAGIVRSAYLAMSLIGLTVIVPLGVASLITGLVQSLGTPWGLFRHYWVLLKFALTVGATVLLLLHQFTAVAAAASRASAGPLATLPDVGRVGTQLVGDAGFAVLLLVVTTTLSVFKPRGLTSYGRRTQQPMPAVADAPRLGAKIALAVVALIVTAFVVLHLAGGGLHHGR